MFILKLVFLFFAVWFTIINIGRVLLKERVPGSNLLIQAIGITGFIVFQWLI